MSNKTKVKNIPCDFNLWLCRKVHQKGYKANRKQMKKAYTTFGFNFNKTAKKMVKLGYQAKYKTYPSERECMRIGWNAQCDAELRRRGEYYGN